MKLEKERREKGRQPGLIRTEGPEGGEDMERERRVFQLQMCEVGGSSARQNITPPARMTAVEEVLGGLKPTLQPWHPLWPHVVGCF